MPSGCATGACVIGVGVEDARGKGDCGCGSSGACTCKPKGGGDCGCNGTCGGCGGGDAHGHDHVEHAHGQRPAWHIGGDEPCSGPVPTDAKPLVLARPVVRHAGPRAPSLVDCVVDAHREGPRTLAPATTRADFQRDPMERGLVLASGKGPGGASAAKGVASAVLPAVIAKEEPSLANATAPSAGLFSVPFGAPSLASLAGSVRPSGDAIQDLMDRAINQSSAQTSAAGSFSAQGLGGNWDPSAALAQAGGGGKQGQPGSTAPVLTPQLLQAGFTGVGQILGQVGTNLNQYYTTRSTTQLAQGQLDNADRQGARMAELERLRITTASALGEAQLALQRTLAQQGLSPTGTPSAEVIALQNQIAQMGATLQQTAMQQAQVQQQAAVAQAQTTGLSGGAWAALGLGVLGLAAGGVYLATRPQQQPTDPYAAR